MTATQKPDESEKGQHMTTEDDIGSGEKTPGEKETDEQIKQIPRQGTQEGGQQDKPS